MITTKKKEPVKKDNIEPENFDLTFKKMIKEIISEEKYFKERDVKDLATSILEQVEPLIVKHIKLHLSAIGQYIVNITTDPKEIDRKDDNAKTS
jgi:nucleoid DNA-binding protein